MGNKNIKHFKNDIRRTFTIYALIPVAIITFFSYLITFSILYRTVVNRNNNINTEVSKRIESVISSYMNQAEKISIQANVIDCLNYRHISRNIYEELYKFVNSMEIKGAFFVFDKNMKPVITSTTILPEYAQEKNTFTGGITRRMLDMPNQVVLAREARVNSSKQTLSIGKSIVRNGEIIGFVTFDLDEKELLKIISQNFSINMVVTDKYGNVISSTNTLLINQFNKIDINFRDKSGFVKSTNDNHYVSITRILDENICIYTITTMGYFCPILIFSGILIILLFGILTLTTFFVAKKIANSKTKVIDEIIESIENVQNGNLDIVLNINTGDEFQVIVESYNQMLIDIKNLIEVNKEQARQSILSEIKQLESQFNPHFLFNTLEIIKYMVKTDPDSVNKIIVGLSSLLRYSINNYITKVTLAEDIEYTKNYLLIQKYRFGNNLDYSINVEQGMCDCIVPKLIVQPIIENAIKYGFENRKSLSVEVKASYIDSNLVVKICDNGMGMESEILEEVKKILEQSKNSSAHIGLFNVHRRIQLMYGERYGIEISSRKNEGTTVKIILPISRSDNKYVEGVNC